MTNESKSDNPTHRRRWLGLGIGVLISAVFLWRALEVLNLGEVWEHIRHAHYIWLLPGVGVYFIAVWVRAWRWHYQLRLIKPIPTRELFPAVVIGYMGNNIYPFRAGEVFRAYVLWRDKGISIAAGLATIVVDRIFDGLTMLIFVFVGLPFALGSIESKTTWLFQLAAISTVFFFIAMVIFLYLASRPALAKRVYGWLIDRFVSQRFREAVHNMVDNFMAGLVALRSPRDMLMILLASVLIWLTETLKYWFVMHAFDFDTSFFVLMLMAAVVNLATMIPSAPGYIGTFDGPGIATLVAFGVDEAIAGGYTLVLHGALFLPVTLLGLWYFVRKGLSWGDFSRAQEKATEVKEKGVHIT